jgi:flotillin
MTKQAEAQRDLEVKRAQYQELVQKQKAQADKAYEIQASVMQQQVVAEQVRVQQVERNEQVKVQEAEIARRKNELIATELESANVQAQRRQVLADGEKRGLELEATGRAEAIRREGQAEAEIIRMKGEAEASAMERKAEAYRLYGQAAVLDKLLSGLPDVVRAISEPLGRVDRITVVSAGDGDGAGAGVSRVTADIAKMVAQVPALVESLSGISVAELLKSLPHLGPAFRAAEVAAARRDATPIAVSPVATDPAIEVRQDNLEPA